jgi:hypothetical protein
VTLFVFAGTIARIAASTALVQLYGADAVYAIVQFLLKVAGVP